MDSNAEDINFVEDINWYAVGSAAFTAIRLEFPVTTVRALALAGNDTPASGDALAIARAEFRKPPARKPIERTHLTIKELDLLKDMGRETTVNGDAIAVHRHELKTAQL